MAWPFLGMTFFKYDMTFFKYDLYWVWHDLFQVWLFLSMAYDLLPFWVWPFLSMTYQSPVCEACVPTPRPTATVVPTGCPPEWPPSTSASPSPAPAHTPRPAPSASGVACWRHSTSPPETSLCRWFGRVSSADSLPCLSHLSREKEWWGGIPRVWHLEYLAKILGKSWILEYLGKILDFILHILTTSWILEIFVRFWILNILARSWILSWHLEGCIVERFSYDRWGFKSIFQKPLFQFNCRLKFCRRQIVYEYQCGKKTRNTGLFSEKKILLGSCWKIFLLRNCWKRLRGIWRTGVLIAWSFNFFSNFSSHVTCHKMWKTEKNY